MPGPTIAAGVAAALLDFAVAEGATRSALLRHSGIDPDAIADRDARVPFTAYVALMRAAKSACDDPALALHFGEAVDLADMSVVGAMGRAASTPSEALAEANRYSRLAADVDSADANRFRLVRDRGALWLVDARDNPNDFPELTESTFARAVSTARRMFGQSNPVKAVHVTHPRPAYASEYDRIFGVPVVFDSDRNAIQVDESWLTQPMPPSSPYAAEILRAHADSLLKSLESSATTRGRVERALVGLLPSGSIGVDVVARELAMSRQTLFRRLKAEGTTFERVLTELRTKQAEQLLRTPHLSLADIAAQLGFSDAAAFSRAFKRWTGSSPQQARQARPRPPA